MSGFKISQNQDISGLFKSAEKAAVVDDDIAKQNKQIESKPTRPQRKQSENKNPHSENNNKTENIETQTNKNPIITHPKIVNDNNPIFTNQQENTTTRKTETLVSSPTENNDNTDNIEKTDNNVDNRENNSFIRNGDKNDVPVDDNLFVDYPNDLEDSSREDVSSSQNDVVDDTYNEKVEIVNNNSNSINNGVDIISVDTIISKSVVSKIITISDCVSGLDENDLDFISKLITKKPYPEDSVDFVFNVINTKHKNIDDVKYLNNILSKNDRVERVFDILELSFDDLNSIGETVELLTGLDVSGNDQKSKARSLELAVQELSVRYDDFLSRHDETINKIMSAL